MTLTSYRVVSDSEINVNGHKRITGEFFGGDPLSREIKTLIAHGYIAKVMC